MIIIEMLMTIVMIEWAMIEIMFYSRKLFETILTTLGVNKETVFTILFMAEFIPTRWPAKIKYSFP